MTVENLHSTPTVGLFLKPCTFVKGVAALTQLPPTPLPEVAFVGRSNVGKSSLINALVHRRNLARTSNTPGRTQQLNFFNLFDQLMLVDLPGYGFAKAPLREIAKWHELIRGYLMERPTLKRVFILVDSRRGLKESDEEMMEMLDSVAMSYEIVFTKIDCVSKTALDELCTNVPLILKNHGAAYPKIGWTSTRKKMGIDDLRLDILSCMS